MAISMDYIRKRDLDGAPMRMSSDHPGVQEPYRNVKMHGRGGIPERQRS